MYHNKGYAIVIMLPELMKGLNKSSQVSFHPLLLFDGSQVAKMKGIFPACHSHKIDRVEAVTL